MELFRTTISIDIKTGKTLSIYTDPKPVKIISESDYTEAMVNLITGKSLKEVHEDLRASYV